MEGISASNTPCEPPPEISEKQRHDERVRLLFECLGHLLERRRSIKDLPGTQFFEAPALAGHLCRDIYGSFPYGLFVVERSALWGACGVMLSEDSELLIEQNAGLVNDESILHNLSCLTKDAESLTAAQEYDHLLSLVSSCCYCFWHWMMDCLPKVVLAEMTGYTGLYLVPPPMMSPWVDECMGLLGVDKERLVRGKGNFVFARNLYIPTYFSGFEAWRNLPFMRLFRERILAGLPRLGVRRRYSSDRLFIPRKPTARFRRILNQDQVSMILERHGFQTAYFEDFPLVEQLTMVSQAKMLVAPHGSGMTHSLFMRQRSSVLELFPRARRESCNCYELLTPVTGHHYTSLESANDNGTDIEVDLAELSEWLESQLANQIG